jgi:hypothetical protein
MKELQHHLIPPLILLLDLILLQIPTCRHPPMHLIREPLNHIRRLETLLPLLDIFFRLMYGIEMPGASAASTIAGWQAAATVKGVEDWDVRFTI